MVAVVRERERERELLCGFYHKLKEKRRGEGGTKVGEGAGVIWFS